MEEENSRHSSPLDGGRVPLDAVWFSRPLGQDQDQVLDKDLNFQRPSFPQFCLGQPGDHFFSLLFLLLLWWLSFVILFQRFLQVGGVFFVASLGFVLRWIRGFVFRER